MNSSLVSYTYTGHGKYNTRNANVTKITIHHLASVGSLDNIRSAIIHNEVSWNYGIGTDGSVGLFVNEEYRSWSTGNVANDDCAINIVVANSSTGPDWLISERAYSTLVRLIIDICERYNIYKLQCTGAASSSNLTLHRWFTKDVICPGPHLFKRIPKMLEEINTKLDKRRIERNTYTEQLFIIEVQVAKNTTTGEYLSRQEIESLENEIQKEIDKYNEDPNYNSNYIKDGEYEFPYTIEWVTLGPNDTIDYPILDYKINIQRNAMHPYIAYIGSRVSSIDYQKLYDNQVIGVLLYAGRKFNDLHEPMPYVSSNLKTQVQQADNANMPYGLVASVRAKNTAEAKIELSDLYKVFSKYRPELGLWLELETTVDKNTNDDILACYYKSFEKWGIADRCGLYLTRSQLSKITWSKFEQYFLLSLVDHVNDVSKLDEVLTINYFNI